MKKILKYLTALMVCFTLIVSILGGNKTYAAERGKCSMTIISNVHTSFSKAAQANGSCYDLVQGSYGVKSGEFVIVGMVSGQVTKNGQTFIMSTPADKYQEAVLTVYTKIVNVDKTPPKLSIGSISDKSTSVTVNTEAKTSVKMYEGTKLLSTVTSDSKGKYTFKFSKKKAGTKLKFVATDKAGNKAEKSIYVMDKTAPSLSIGSISDKSTSITGKTEAKRPVKLYVNGKYKSSVTTNSKGSYTLKISKMKAGTKLKFITTDKAGNKTEKPLTVLDRTAPSTPTVNSVTSKSTSVSGKSEKNVTVYVYNGKKKLGTTKVNSKGSYSVKITKQKKGSTLSVYGIDHAKNKSKSKVIKVK